MSFILEDGQAAVAVQGGVHHETPGFQALGQGFHELLFVVHQEDFDFHRLNLHYPFPSPLKI
jgi:hypothetical protein